MSGWRRLVTFKNAAKCAEYVCFFAAATSFIDRSHAEGALYIGFAIYYRLVGRDVQ